MSQSTIILDPKSEIRAKQSTDTYIIKPTAIKSKESIRIDAIRELLSWSSKTSFTDENRVVVIEDFHKISANAAHTLLKLLEEPPQDMSIVLLVDQAESLLETITSRCAMVSSFRLSDEQLASWCLERTSPTAPAVQEPWQSFYQKSEVERLQWISVFVKGKKNLTEQLLAWQREVSSLIESTDTQMKPQYIRILGLIENSISAAASNVLPRLVLNALAIQLSSRQK